MPGRGSWGSDGRDNLAHVALKPLGVKLDPSSTAHITYDDGCRVLLVAEQDRLFSWPVERMSQVETQGITPTAKISSLSPGPVLGARYSLDGSVLAIQRSSVALELIPESGGAFWQRVQGPLLLGFFWVSTPDCDLVLVTPAGLELFRLHPNRTGLQPVEVKKHQVAWYTYTHETRLVLLASSTSAPARMRAYQFANSGIVKLPKFDLEPPPASRAERAPPAVDAGSVVLLVMYGRMYCAHLDTQQGQLTLYRFFRDALVCQHKVPLYSNQVRLSVVDNTLLVHNIDSGVVLVLDILSSSPLHPLASPLPPHVLPPHVLPSLSTSSSSSPPSAPGEAESLGHAPPPYSASCRFLGPNLVVDQSSGTVWRLQLSLSGLEASCPDRLALLSFLLRRRQDLPYQTPEETPRALALSLTKTMLQERESLLIVSRCFDLLCSTYQEAFKDAYNAKHPQRPHPPITAPYYQTNRGISSPSSSSTPLLPRSAALSPDDLLQRVFLTLAEEEDVGDGLEEHGKVNGMGEGGGVGTGGARGGSSNGEEHGSLSLAAERRKEEEKADRGVEYLLAVAVEYVRCAETHSLSPPPALILHLLTLLRRLRRLHLLPAYVPLLRKPPGAQLALQVAALGAQYPPALHVAQDMLHRPTCHQAHVNLMIKEGRIVDALRYVRRQRVESIPPTVFLDAAWDHPILFQAVFRFCHQFVPAFTNIADFPKYKERLKASLPEKQRME
mmetsp:Transcript_34517/g.47834  ORF Transcript_34517/g.47834 Transcript_34517/m.47834 type:complete len:727 (+) Transcript_34517:464-2644(+)|eukprot:CAMPEP_0196587518 /NCGR_PEP_ID=MMETSP1081-20130531/57673_1 /TAXON_ID=36882 /ORGANISM="Pyramimonas amylifera, Strain CCMP720" /LENGTH=726 /DNA_ID=CAMNT_0041909715 /DNA_START=454 /DNA_END=2634 /DNA_ORIENTATION=-